MVAQSEEAGYNHYVGVGKLMEAFIVLTATDLWGDIPYSDALLFGEQGVYLPTFDSQESVYNAIFERINEGRTALAGDNGGNPPGNDDLIYGGDIDRWLKFANVLEARARIHLAKKDGGSYAAALAALNNGGFESNADNCTFQFGAAPSENAPFFQYIEQRDDCEVAVSFVSLLNGLGDPREAIYGATHDVPGHPVFTPDQNMPMMTFAEQEFIRAEALFGSDKAAAYDAYLAGVAASLAEAGVAEGDATAYLEGSSVAVGASGLTMEHIMVQKYIAIYTNPEAFSDWRRTGYPSLAPHAGSEIPRRLPYSEAELLSNENTPTPAEITIYDRVWWDQ